MVLKFFKNWMEARCHHPKLVKQSVSPLWHMGQNMMQTHLCELNRESEDKCGKDAKFFEPKGSK